MNKPLSEKIASYESVNFHVTAAIWRGRLGESYEIGIRSKTNPNQFRLLQSEKFTHQSVQEMAEIVCLTLDHGYSPEWCQDFLK